MKLDYDLIGFLILHCIVQKRIKKKRYWIAFFFNVFFDDIGSSISLSVDGDLGK